MRSSRRGFTVVETVVALSLLSLLLLGLYAVLTIGYRQAREAEVFETVHREAMVGVKKLTQEIELTSRGSFSDLSSGPTFVIFASPQQLQSAPNFEQYSYDGNGDLRWQKWVCYYLDSADQTVYRAEMALPSPVPAPPTAATQPPLSDFQALSAAERKPVFRNCSQLRFRVGTTPASVRLTLETSDNVNSDKVTRILIDNEIVPRNTV